jgi:hypothetical protein
VHLIKATMCLFAAVEALADFGLIRSRRRNVTR